MVPACRERRAKFICCIWVTTASAGDKSKTVGAGGALAAAGEVGGEELEGVGLEEVVVDGDGAGFGADAERTVECWRRQYRTVQVATDTDAAFRFDLSINMGVDEIGEELVDDFVDDVVEDTIEDDRKLERNVGNALRHRRREETPLRCVQVAG